MLSLQHENGEFGFRQVFHRARYVREDEEKRAMGEGMVHGHFTKFRECGFIALISEGPPEMYSMTPFGIDHTVMTFFRSIAHIETVDELRNKFASPVGQAAIHFAQTPGLEQA